MYVNDMHIVSFRSQLKNLSASSVFCSCHGDDSKQRNRLILPSVYSTRIYIIDTGTNPRAPSIAKVSWLYVCMYVCMYVPTQI